VLVHKKQMQQKETNKSIAKGTFERSHITIEMAPAAVAVVDVSERRVPPLHVDEQ
jgi:hypothetical protein